MSSRLPVRAVAILFLVAGVATSGLGQCPDGTPPPCASARPPAPPDPHSIAVLYFRNVTGDTSDAYLADGLTEALIARLGRIGRVSVLGRDAVARYRGRPAADPRGVGRALRVANLLSGTLRRSGGRIRITVELTRAATGMVLWSEQYTRSGDDLLGVEEEVSRAVIEGVVGRLIPGELASLSSRPTENGPAYQRFLRGNAFLAQRTPAGVIRAVAEYEAAARLDTAFSEAFARIALAHEFYLDWGWPYPGLPPESVLARGFAAAERAMRLNPMSSDAWMAHGMLLAKRQPRTYEGAIPALERSIALDARNAEAVHQLGTLYWQLGNDSAATAMSLRALAIEPRRTITLFQLALSSWTSRRPDQTRAWLDSTVAADPMFGYALAFRAYFRARAGDIAGAREDARDAGQGGPVNRLPGATALVDIDALTGDTAAARARLDSLPRLFVDPAHPTFREGLFAATAAIAAGVNARALDILESVQPRGAELWSGLRLPVFDPLREQPRFRKLVQESRPPAG